MIDAMIPASGASMRLWQAAEPLVLASRSESRRALLAGAAIPVEVLPADIDERAIEARAGTKPPDEIAILLARDEAVLLEHCEIARLTMRNFSDRFLDSYMEAAGPAVTASVGGYQVERAGIQLFERIEGDHFTILGLPLLRLLQYLRSQGWLAD